MDRVREPGLPTRFQKPAGNVRDLLMLVERAGRPGDHERTAGRLVVVVHGQPERVAQRHLAAGLERQRGGQIGLRRDRPPSPASERPANAPRAAVEPFA